MDALEQEHLMMVPFNANLIKLEFVAAHMMGQLVQPLFHAVITRCLILMRFQNVLKTVEDFVLEMNCSVTYVVALEEIVILMRFGHPHPIQVRRNSLISIGCLFEILWFPFYCTYTYNYILIGNDFECFIENHKPVVFTKESVDPYVCGHQASRCATKVSEVYEIAGIPMEINGQKCTNFIECNDPSHGDLSE